MEKIRVRDRLGRMLEAIAAIEDYTDDVGRAVFAARLTVYTKIRIFV